MSVGVERPVLRWHGGKWLLAPWITSLFPKHRIYVEPFGGAGSVLLRKERSYAEVYNDIDGEVVNLFHVLRDPEKGARLKEALTLTPFSRDEFVGAYLEGGDDVERARRMVVRSFQGFGSAASGSHYSTVFRADSNRSGTTPAHDWVNYPEVLPAVTERLRGVVIENRDWRKVLAAHDRPEAFFYCDPPYPRSTRNTTGRCYAVEMTDEEHEELATALAGIEGMAMVSGYPCELYERVFAGWYQEKKASMADGASPRLEVVWMNDACMRHRTASRDLFEEVGA